MTEEKKYSLSIWLRQPARKIRFTNVTEDELSGIAGVMSDLKWTEMHGTTKDGRIVVIPASNVAYIEAREL